MERDLDLRALAADDFEAVVEIDRKIIGRSRRGYMEKRLRAALRQPDAHIQLAACDAGVLAGFVLARIVEGEFGRSRAGVVLEAIGIDPGRQRRGAGRALLDGLQQVMRRKGIDELVTQAEWTNRPLLGFLAAAGFSLAPLMILEGPRALPAGAGAGDAAVNDPLARDAVPVRCLMIEDLAAVARIDRMVTGRDRTGYYRLKFDEALNESAIRVSLVAEIGGMPAGFIMARVDFGGFGQTEPVAVIDTMGIDPASSGHGIGRALLAQLLSNLAALRVERVETQVPRDNFPLLGFFYHCGFGPSQNLAFRKQVA